MTLPLMNGASLVAGVEGLSLEATALGFRNWRRGLEEPERALMLDLEATMARLPRNADGASIREADTEAISESQSELGGGRTIEGCGDALWRLRRVATCQTEAPTKQNALLCGGKSRVEIRSIIDKTRAN